MQPSLQRGGCPSLSNNVQVFFLSCIKKKGEEKGKKKSIHQLSRNVGKPPQGMQIA